MDLFSVEGKTALVTGGSRGIGLMIARGFVEGGARVYVSSRKAAVCQQVAEELSRVGACVALPADLSGEAACRALAAQVAEREGRLHVLVNNAGATWGAPLEAYPAAAWDKVLDLNLKAPFFLTRAMLPLLEAAAAPDDPARVVNVGSIDGLRVPPMPTYAYSASKAGLYQLTRTLARELGPRGITVNAIAPGPFESKMMAETLRVFGDQIAAAAPLGRIGRARRHGRGGAVPGQPGRHLCHRGGAAGRRRPHHGVAPDWHSPAESLTVSADSSDPVP